MDVAVINCLILITVGATTVDRALAGYYTLNDSFLVLFSRLDNGGILWPKTLRAHLRS